jgi:hypothetical protein
LFQHFNKNSWPFSDVLFVLLGACFQHLPSPENELEGPQVECPSFDTCREQITILAALRARCVAPIQSSVHSRMGINSIGCKSAGM